MGNVVFLGQCARDDRPLYIKQEDRYATSKSCNDLRYKAELAKGCQQSPVIAIDFTYTTSLIPHFDDQHHP